MDYIFQRMENKNINSQSQVNEDEKDKTKEGKLFPHQDACVSAETLSE